MSTFGYKHPKYANAVMDYLRQLDKDILFMQGQAEALSKQKMV